MSELKLRIAAGTNVGLIRQNNEDNFIVSSDLSTSEWTIPQADSMVDLGAYGSLLMVADGMGGANAGEVASEIAIETIRKAFQPDELAKVVASDDAIVGFMKDTLKKADLNVLNHAMADESTQGMGTTAVIAWILRDKVYVCWCGDSRCYIFNPAVGLTQLSKDHSYVQELIDKGELDPENAHDHPYSNIITQCLGDTANRVNPDSRIHRLANGDILLLCSDGLSGLCYDDQIMDTMSDCLDDLNTMKNQLIDDALAAGGYDNVTVALCEVKVEGEPIQSSNDLERTVRSASISRRMGRWITVLLLLVVIVVVIYYFV